MPDPAESQFTHVASVYDSLMSVVPYHVWVDYVEGLWALWGFKPRRVLDLACGTGNVALELLARGYEAEGADYSEAMIEIARRKSPDTPFWHQDARSLQLPGAPFDACVCLFDSLNYLLTTDDLRRAFSGVRRHLAPGGSMVFDMNTVRALETGMFNQRGTGRDDRLTFDWHSAWDPRSRLCTIAMEFRVREARESREGQQTRVFHETHVQRGYTESEIRSAAEDAGLELLSIYQAFTTRPLAARSDRLHALLRRP